jgi:hypothetical protein
MNYFFEENLMDEGGGAHLRSMLYRVTYHFMGYNMGNPFAIRRLRQKGVGKRQLWAAWSGHVAAEFTGVSGNDASKGQTSPRESGEVEGGCESVYVISETPRGREQAHRKE